MNKVILFCSMIVLLSGCGKGSGSGSATSGTPGQNPSGPSKNQYRIVVTGDNVQFVSGAIDLDVGYADHWQDTIAPAVTIPAGSQYELDELSFNIQNLVIQPTNMNGTPTMTAKLYKNGVVVEQSTLTTAGTFHAFSNY